MNSPWIRRAPTTKGTARLSPGGPRLVCFPHAGGAASVYWPLARELGPHAEVFAVQYPGRQERSAELMTDLHTLADRIAQELTALGMAGSVFLGHSMGALVAYEVAVRLGRSGPSVLIPSGCRAPSRHGGGALHLRDDDGLAQHLSALGGTSVELLDDPGMRAIVLATVRADYEALAGYRHRRDPPLACPVIALAGDRDPVAPADDIKTWNEHTTGSFHIQTFPGDHFFLHARLAEVAHTIRSVFPKEAA